jgi:hypothetical protein
MYLKFKLGDAARAALRSGSPKAELSIDLPGAEAQASLPRDVVGSLAEDFGP